METNKRERNCAQSTNVRKKRLKEEIDKSEKRIQKKTQEY
jgi:hypothetical protein